jgi:hypothetical protein
MGELAVELLKAAKESAAVSWLEQHLEARFNTWWMNATGGSW